MSGFSRHYDFPCSVDESWELIPEDDWVWQDVADGSRLVNGGDGNAHIFVRPCSIYGDTVCFELAGDTRRGVFTFGWTAGFEYINFKLDLSSGELRLDTQEHHKAQPRLTTTVPTTFKSIAVRRAEWPLPRLPYTGSSVTLQVDGRDVTRVDAIDFLPEAHFMFGLDGPGDITVSSFSIEGPQRPRPEHLIVGAWQQRIKPSTHESVDALIEGVRRAAEEGVQLLVTPETSLTGLRPDHSELADEVAIQAAVDRFCKAVAGIGNAPYTLVGYPEWIDGSEVDGAELDRVKVNAHRFVRPDGTLGPRMAKVHSCEMGLWHGRHYNLQRVCGAEVAVGVCHDGRYQDVWTTGVMGGARLCLHPSAGGTPSGAIPEIVQSYATKGNAFDAWWVGVNAGGGGAICYPQKNRKVPDPVLAVTSDLTEANPDYPDFTPVADSLASARIRLWEAAGSWPQRTLRSGKTGYENWSRLIPELVEV